MSLKRSKVQKENLLKLKKEIVDFTTDFKKRYQLFPWSKVNKLTKIEMRSSSPITVNGSEFTVMSLVKEINKSKTKIQSRLKPSYYNFLLKAYIKDSMNLEDKEVNSIYKEYEEQLNGLFKETKQDLMFCLEGLKQINKAFKKEEVTESVSNDANKKILDDFKHYVKGCRMDCDPMYADIRPLDNPMIHKSKKNGDMLLLATTSIGKYKKEKVNKVMGELKKNVLYDGQEVEFHTCYLPGDVFIFIKLRDIVTESCHNSDRENILNKALDVLEDKGRTPKVSKKSKENWINGKGTDFDDALCIAGLGNDGLQSLCTEVNKIIKPLGGKVSPDNYGTIFLSIKESEEITMNHWYDYVSESGDYVDLRDFVLECYQAVENDVEDDTFEEGTNLDIRAELKPMKAQYKKMMKEIKKAKKDGNIDKAIKIAQQLSDLTKDVHKKINGMDSTVGSVIFGFFTSWTITFFRDLVLVLASPFTVGVTGFVAWAKDLIEKWKKPVKRLINSEGLSKDDFNFYKNKALDQAENMMKASKRLVDTLKEEKKEIDKEKKEAAKKDKAVKESAEFKNAKYALYEACHNGEITIEEREELFKDLQDKFYVKEKTSDIMEDTSKTKNQRFDECRKVLYERCSQGEITVSERESLIGKAYDMIFVKEEANDETSGADDKEAEKNVEDAIKDGGSDMSKELDKAIK